MSARKEGREKEEGQLSRELVGEGIVLVALQLQHGSRRGVDRDLHGAREFRGDDGEGRLLLRERDRAETAQNEDERKLSGHRHSLLLLVVCKRKRE